MIPRPLLLVLFCAPIVPLVVGIWIPALTPIAWLSNVVLLLVALFDLAISPWPRSLAISREVSEVLSVGVENPVSLALKNGSRQALDLWVTDGPPEPSRTTGLPVRLRLGSGQSAQATYRLRPERRGRFRFDRVFARYPSRLRLWSFNLRRPLETAVRVYPDIRGVEGFDMLAKRNELQELGLKLWRLRGKEGEFERLREYRREDELRSIDWKATAKRDKLISREYTVERNQNVLFLLDAGRSMIHETDGVSNLDRSINAALMLAYIALGQGDNVGLIAFSNRMERVVRPVRGRGAVKGLIRSLFDLEPSWETSDYGLACEQLLNRQRKRALVVMMTFALEEQHLATIGRYVRPLAATHLFLCVLLRDTSLVALADKAADSDREAFQTAAAAELLEGQARQIARLREAGVLVVETLPSQLSSDVINKYLELKARHLL